ncbi:type IV pilus assembly protein PilM [Dehalogenimonas formicexedens]|uniref:Type IV pilus assembly protein PilM n=1 Tax=Dehalogenimonas formicexedens TaxID=1839801 RepID=A0A1P8F895_9CHLR|nr:pilus assembly protein PilM [Dehalogenimonas formicexedens]APV44622.1 type IV pilus assembly protein PilM [Dehalogenimonas formicexedens]
MAKTLTTVYIEDNEIELLVTAGKQVEKWAMAPLDSGMVNEGVIMQEDAVAERLKKLASDNGVAGHQVVAAVSGQNSIFRIINIPEVPKNILDDAIMSEATRVIPVPMDQVYVARQELQTKVPHEMRFFLAAHPKNATDSLMRTLTKAGLKSKVLDVAPLALARNVNRSRCVVVNTWLSTIDIIVLVDRVPEVIRSFSLGSEHLTDSERLGTIAEEISRTVVFYNSSHTEDPLGAEVPILVAGELAADKEQWSVLGGTDGRPVEALTTEFTAPEGFDASRFMVNLGMAQRDLPNEFGSVINLNAIPAIYLPRGVNWFNILAPAVGVLLIGALVYGWTYVDKAKKDADAIQPQIDAITLQVTQAQAKLAGIKPQIDAANAAVTPVQTEAAAYASFYQVLQDQRSMASGYVRSAWLEKRNITQIQLDSISWDGTSVVIVGTATTSESIVFDYATELRDTYRFQNVIVTSIVKELTTDTMVYVYHFTLTCV